MMHETPPEVSAALARHSPRNIARVLDPAVGNGALLRPLLGRMRKNGSVIVCVDIDATALRRLSAEIIETGNDRITLVNESFVDWSDRTKEEPFDLIVMNPPFAARKEESVFVNTHFNFTNSSEARRQIPIEAVFVLRALRLLKPGGRLLAILPASIVSSESLGWFRNEIAKIAAFQIVHELPPNTFRNVESRVYICVIELGRKQGAILLQNHDLRCPRNLQITRDAFQTNLRLDYGFFNSLQLQRNSIRDSSFEWAPLKTVALVLRGSAASPQGTRTALHTTDYHAGFWRRRLRHRTSQTDKEERRARRGDIFIKRVGRGCTTTAGLGINLVGTRCSDCIFIIRPAAAKASKGILFTLRVALGFSWASPLIAKGTGASFITYESLNSFMIPIGIENVYRTYFDEYIRAVERRAFSTMLRLEEDVRALICDRENSANADKLSN